MNRCNAIDTTGGEWALRYWSDVTKSVAHLAANGVAFSRRRLRDLHARATLRARRCVQAVHDQFDVPLAGEGSAKAQRAMVEKALDDLTHDERDHKALRPTKKAGHPPTTRAARVLLGYMLPPDHPLRPYFRMATRFARARDITSRYTQKLLDLGVPFPGPASDTIIIYPSWFTTPGPFSESRGKQAEEGGTTQGRITCTGPPLQTLPAVLKACMVSRYPGGRLRTFDLSQIEMRVAGILSGDPYILDAYAHNRDMHADLAVAVAGPAILAAPFFGSGDNQKDPRQTFKSVRFLSLYEGEAAKAQLVLLQKAETHVPIDTLRRAIRVVRDQQAVWFRWADEYVADVARHGRLVLPYTLLCRHLDVPGDPTGQARRAALNCPVQATAAAVLLRVEAALDGLLPPVVLPVLNTYDALTLDEPADRDATAEIAEAFRLVESPTDGLWAMIQQHYGHCCPLKYGTKVHGEATIHRGRGQTREIAFDLSDPAADPDESGDGGDDDGDAECGM